MNIIIVFLSITLFLVSILSFLIFYHNIQKFKAKIVADKLSIFLSVIFLLVYLSFFVKGIKGNNLADRDYWHGLMVFLEFLYLCIYFLFQQNFFAYSQDFIFIGIKKIKINDLVLKTVKTNCFNHVVMKMSDNSDSAIGKNYLQIILKCLTLEQSVLVLLKMKLWMESNIHA